MDPGDVLAPAGDRAADAEPKGGSIFASAPPPRSSTTPVRTCTTRTPSSCGPSRLGLPLGAHVAPGSRCPAGASSSSGSSPCGAVVADRRGAHQHARARARRSRAGPRRGGACRSRGSRGSPAWPPRPALGDVLAGQVHDRVAPRERAAPAPARCIRSQRDGLRPSPSARARAARAGSRESTVTCARARAARATSARTDQPRRTRHRHAHGAHAVSFSHARRRPTVGRAGRRGAAGHRVALGEPHLLAGQRGAGRSRLVGDGGGHGGRDVAVEDRGDDVVLAQLAAPRRSRRSRCAAAIFISSVIAVARTSSAPRKMPGKHSTLLIWLG